MQKGESLCGFLLFYRYAAILSLYLIVIKTSGAWSFNV